MCGPIVIVLPARSGSMAAFIFGRILYNVGRAVTYAGMGAVVGVIGQFVVLAGYQQILGFVAGGLMIISVLLPSRFAARLLPKRMDAWMDRIKSRLGDMLAAGSTRAMFSIGLLNGFLPCGLVYAALAASVSAGGIVGGALFMFVFGVGTIPALFTLSFAGGFITGRLRGRLTRLIPVTIAIMGLLFILRGMSLGIPFISPKMEKMISKGQMVGGERQE
jgi:sulfite exporter TauE/SafE